MNVQTPEDAQAVRRRVGRQVAGMFVLAALLAALSVVAYFALEIRDDGDGVSVGAVQISNLTLGLLLGFGTLLAGIGAIRYARMLPGTAAETPDDTAYPQIAADSAAPSVGRRRLVRASLLALALLPLPAAVLLRNVAPATTSARRHTVWAPGVRLLTDVSNRPIRPSDLEVGQLVNVLPESLGDVPSDGAEINARAKAAVVLVRMKPHDIVPADGRGGWHVDGMVAYSKICTHVGCPMGLYERTTKHLLCPCHQSTFDLADSGTVVFGPATRSLPQLPLAVDDDGHLVALSDFTEPVGPSYWER